MPPVLLGVEVICNDVLQVTLRKMQQGEGFCEGVVVRGLLHAFALNLLKQLFRVPIKVSDL